VFENLTKIINSTHLKDIAITGQTLSYYTAKAVILSGNMTAFAMLLYLAPQGASLTRGAVARATLATAFVCPAALYVAYGSEGKDNDDGEDYVGYGIHVFFLNANYRILIRAIRLIHVNPLSKKKSM
jgi:hypothetical protein